MLGEPSFRLANLMKDKAKSMKIYEVADRAPEARGFGLENQLLRFGIGKFVKRAYRQRAEPHRGGLLRMHGLCNVQAHRIQ